MQTLVEKISPNGNIEAIVEQDERVAFFYLRGAPEIEFGVRSCWVRNLAPAPPTLDVAAMKKGETPMLPRQHCLHPLGAPRLDPSRLKVIWFEEGDAAALLEDDQPLAIIPSWSGSGGFEGYARDCTTDNPLCWPLFEDNVLHDRIRAAGEYWSSWHSDTDPWTVVQQQELAAYAEQIGSHEKYYVIDGGEWPPRALLRIPVRGGVALATVGICLRPQPLVEMATESPEEYRRIELGAGIATDAPEHFESYARYLSGQSNLPWAAYSWLGPQHTVPCDAFPGTHFQAVLLSRDAFDSPRLSLPSFRGDPVNVLWVVPITKAEREFAVERGAGELVQRLKNAGVGWLFRARPSVI